MSLRTWSSVLLLVGLAACLPRPAGGASASYTCGDLRFSVVFRDDSAHLTLPDTALTLPLAISASGARYSDGVSTFWEHQGTARLELRRDTFVSCVPRDA